MDNLVKLAT